MFRLKYKIINSAGTHKIRVVIDDADKFYSNSSYVTVKVSTSIASSAVSAVYKDSKYLVATLKDGQGKAIAGAEISTNINGLKTLKTDKNGQVKWSVASLAPKTYNVVLTFSGKDHYLKSTNKVTVKIAKATPKLTAKKKTFKKSIKVKKYSVVLKDNKGKAIKKATVSIKVGKKTFKAKTNSKGKATFKIKKLTKKGKYKSTVKYAGNAYYKAVSKKVTIKIK